MVDWIKTHKKLFFTVCSIVLLIAILGGIAVSTKLIDLGIDILCRPGDYEGTVTVIDSDGYLHLTSDRSKYNAQETMELTLHSAYYESMEDAEKAKEVWAVVHHGEYLQIEIVGADEMETIEEEPVELPEVNDWITVGTFTQFDPADLLIQPHGFLKRVTRESLHHSVTVNIKVKEDAPESFEDTLMIYIRSDHKSGIVNLGVGKCGVVFVTVKRDGDTVKLYAANDSSLGKRNYW